MKGYRRLLRAASEAPFRLGSAAERRLLRLHLLGPPRPLTHYVLAKLARRWDLAHCLLSHHPGLDLQWVKRASPRQGAFVLRRFR